MRRFLSTATQRYLLPAAILATVLLMLQGSSDMDIGSTGALGTLWASVTVPEEKPAENKPEPEPERRPCCALGISYLSGPGKVVLEQVCNRGNQTVFYLRTEGLPATCTHPPGTILTDQNGHRYAMVGFDGMPSCQSGSFTSSANTRFTWSFQKLQSGVSSITLMEVEDPVTAGLTFWAWRNVSVQHCQL